MAVVSAEFYEFIKQRCRTDWWRARLVQFTILFIEFGLWVFALTPSVQWPWLYELHMGAWICEILLMFGCVYYNFETGASFTLGRLVSIMLFGTKMWAHLTILLDAHGTRKSHLSIKKKYSIIKRHLREGLGSSLDLWLVGWRLTVRILLMMLLFTVCHVLIIWSTFKSSSAAVAAFYWYSFLNTMALQFKILEFFVLIAVFNGHAEIVRRHLNELGERNLRCVFKLPAKKVQLKGALVFVLPPECAEQEQEQLRQLAILKKIYSEIYTLFQIFNSSHGWSLMAFTMMYFTELVCNSYRVILQLITQGSESYAFIQSGCFLVIVVMQLTVLCSYCQESYNHVSVQFASNNGVLD